MGEPAKDYSQDDLLALGQAVLSFLADWGLSEEKQAAMLGLSNHPDSIDSIRKGAPLPKDGDVIERASLFMNLSLALNALYNYEAEWLRGWMLQGNEDLGGQTPFNFIREYGVTGLAWLDDHLHQKLAEQNPPEFALDNAG